MKLIEKTLNGICVFEPKVFGDHRGYFFESFRADMIPEDLNFVQDNESLSSKNILRGLHFQNPPHDQGKLVRVTSGAVLDIAVDIRKGSPSYGQHFKTVLSSENKFVMWIPPGFAHGFLTLKDNTRFLYKCTNYYNQASEGGLNWNDPELAIDWGIKKPILSEKDNNYPSFKNFRSAFDYV